MLTRRTVRLVRFLPLAAALTACATARTPDAVDDSALPTTYVQAVNRNAEAIDLRLAVNGTELPLGTLPGLASRTFVVPSRYLAGEQSDYRLIAQPRGARVKLESPSFPMRMGQRVVWTIEYRPPALWMAKAG